MSFTEWKSRSAFLSAPVLFEEVSLQKNWRPRGRHPVDMMVSGKPENFYESLTDVVSVIRLQ